MHDTRPEVARRVDGISGRPPKRETDRQYQTADSQRIKAFHKTAGAQGRKPEHQDEGADEFTDKIAGRISNSGTCAENCEFRARIHRARPVRHILKPDERGTRHSAQHLSDDVRTYFRPVELAGSSKRNRNGWVEVRTADTAHRIHGKCNRKGPANGNDDPARIFIFCILQNNTCHDTVSE